MRATAKKVNVAMKPTAYSIGVVIRGRVPHMLAIQERTWIPLGMAMVMLAAVKKLMASGATAPVENI